MSEPFLGQIVMFAGNFAPRSWAFCAGQLLPISQNTALFAILGPTYGGNGTTTFALPDLSGRVPVGVGLGPGLSNVVLGESSGAEVVTLSTAQMPAHNHGVAASNAAATSSRPAGSFPSGGGAYSNTSDGSTMSPSMVRLAGGNQPHENRQPYLGVNFIICIQGVFPSRN